MAEKVLLAAVGLKKKPKYFLREGIDEMKELIRSAGGVVAGSVNAAIERPSPSHFIHSGKLEEIKHLCRSANADLIVFSMDLSPVQNRNLENACGIRVVDRTGLILDIFAKRAQSSEGRLQVELAQLNYLLPRLVGQGVLLSRLGGGIGTRGPGEQKLEVNRRKIRERISRIRRELERVRCHRELLRQSRKRKAFKLAAIVGYTNAGKSSLLNVFTGANVTAEDKLFATLDPTTRLFVMPDGSRILLTDTVGFLKDLPHHLIEAFKATLEEVTDADLLIHVVDAANPFAEEQLRVSNHLLDQLGALHKPTILVLNKADLLSAVEQKRTLEQFPEGVLISIKERQNLPALVEKIKAASEMPEAVSKTLGRTLE